MTAPFSMSHLTKKRRTDMHRLSKAAENFVDFLAEGLHSHAFVQPNRRVR